MLTPPAAPDGINLALTAYRHLRGMVMRGELAAGEAIQERRLAEALGLSRTPVRDALGRLEGERLLARQGRLLVVASLSPAEVIDILQLRRLLEGEAARLAATRMAEAAIAALRAALLRMKDEQSLTDEAHWAQDDALHRGIADASGNAEMGRVIHDLRQRTRIFGLHRIPERFARGREEHLAILDAIAARAPEEAAQRMRHHLDQARDAIIATLRRELAA
ncbi:GntR family transcriptional regulator [Roseomonas sp. GC11]|uniref:GntR family transcriptional regulator n=1 Tax=Roseomonas sp. GC11 TaxID=2950546 RepID=UPI0021086AB5|nr:GntR family transcriptional regulator [Roseomonas sp. GC11]MCQ4159338.1 GntR family transcriptional regulator [Roseomonas sp. GC11]